MPLYHHVFQGLTPSSDAWSFSWWSDSASLIDAIHAEAEAWISDFWAGPSGTDGYASLLHPSATANLIRTSLVNLSDGQQLQLRESNVGLTGAGVGNSFPADIAICVSLRTDLANRRGRGRFFLPCPVVTAGTTAGRMTAEAQSTILTALGNAWTGYSAVATPVVYSRVNRATTDVVSFNVGDLFDTQRRRESSLTENRVGQNMP